MKKSIIALAVAAVLPLAASAEGLSLSGSVETKYIFDGKVDTDASLIITSSELLRNGMTATAEFDMSESYKNSSVAGIVTLSSDAFGTLTGGKIDADSAFQFGDVADIFTDTQDIDEDSLNVQGMHYVGTMGNISIAAQLNAQTDASGLIDSDKKFLKGNQFGVVYNMNGFKLGGSWTSAATVDTGTLLLDTNEGVLEKTSAFGASYSFGDFVFQVGKQMTEEGQAKKSISGAFTYTATFDDIKLEATAKHYGNSKDGHKFVASYTMDNISITGTSEYIPVDLKSVSANTIEAQYKSGGLTLTADNEKHITASWDMGNADLILESEPLINAAKDRETSLTYKVSF